MNTQQEDLLDDAIDLLIKSGHELSVEFLILAVEAIKRERHKVSLKGDLEDDISIV